MVRAFLLLGFLSILVGCGSGDSKAIVNDKALTEEEKAAIKAADDAVNAEESSGRPGGATAS